MTETSQWTLKGKIQRKIAKIVHQVIHKVRTTTRGVVRVRVEKAKFWTLRIHLNFRLA